MEREKTIHFANDRSFLDFYRNHLTRVILPFWVKAADTHRGGVFTCFTNDGSLLLSKDKYTWSQGRFLWLWSRIASMMEEKKLAGDPEPFYRQAKKTASFLMNHVFLENGNCAFLLSETGEKMEPVPGQGWDTSIYADCFVCLGLAEYVRAEKKLDLLEPVLALYDRIRRRLASGNFRSEPYPVPKGYKAHAISMIMLHVSQELAEALAEYRHPRSLDVLRHSLDYMHEVMDEWMEEDGRVVELRPERKSERDTLLSRHVNPGHAVECMWFVMQTAKRVGRMEMISKAVKGIKKAFALGWDDEWGGLYRFTDVSGGQPKGRTVHHPYEQLILQTWDTKLWWPHSEALYAALLGYRLTGDEDLWSLFQRTERYVFGTFPHPDPALGEWIQIRDRKGEPLNQTVALPVKDPYHILRNLLLIIDLLSEEQ